MSEAVRNGVLRISLSTTEKIIRDHVLIAGQDEHHREGTYYIEWYEIENHRHRQSVPDFADLLDAARRKAIEIEAMRAGVIRADTNPKTDDGSRIQIGAAIDSYLDWINHNRSHSTYRSYSNTLGNLLRKSCTKVYVRETERDEILKFMTDCYKAGLAARTVYDKVVVALQMFKHFGVTNLLRPSDWPNYVETIRPIYVAEEILLMFQHAEEIEALFMKFLLCSGFRDQESQHVTFRDIDFGTCLARVTAKPRWGFQPKNHEERAVPLPTLLIEQLLALKQRRNAQPAELLFPNSKGNPNSENDMIVKRVAERAKLNCGQCVTRHGNRCSQGPHCQHLLFTNSVTLLPPSICAMESISRLYSFGWDTKTSNQPWCI
jgi:integrase